MSMSSQLVVRRMQSAAMKTAARIMFLLVMSLALAPLTVSMIAGSLTVTKPEDVGVSSGRLQRIHDTIQRHMDAGDIAGAVTLVARRGRIAHFETHVFMDLGAKK